MSTRVVRSGRIAHLVVERCAQCPFGEWDATPVSSAVDGRLMCSHAQPPKTISEYPNPPDIPDWCPLAKVAMGEA